MSLAVDLRAQVGAFSLDVRFTAEPGITALFGPSGAGKTLTLRCIAGLTRPAAGRIALASRLLFDSATKVWVSPQGRRVGYVFQQYALFPHLSVAENVGFGIHTLARFQRDERVAELLRLVGLEGYQQRRPAQLSGGQQQRVALARALATEPDLLLLDEPFAAVDLRLRRRLRAELRNIHDTTGIPMLFVTHDLSEVRELADSFLLIDQGSIVEAGPTADILTTPLRPSLAELLGDVIP